LPVVSTPGTAGEQGLGLGLTLAAEHMRRIGGDLSLGTADGGGGEAKLRVPLATPS
jgi:C4-dicarboxylate-specific signal transduction histidine kinase